MVEETAAHWDAAYRSRAHDQMSWYQPEPAVSLRLLATYARPGGAVVDVGAGESFLVDALLDRGWTDVTVLDVSPASLAEVRGRLGERPGASFVVSDLRQWRPGRVFDAWHDRAAFHFLTAPEDREGYVRTAEAAVRPGGVLVLATFAERGPTSCSGLPTARYGPEGLASVFVDGFVLEHAEAEDHVTPTGAVQPFTWVVLRRR